MRNNARYFVSSGLTLAIEYRKPANSLLRIVKTYAKAIRIFSFKNIIDLNFRDKDVLILLISNTVRNNLVGEMAQKIF